MITYTYSKARKQLNEVLEKANQEEVIIKRKNGLIYSIKLKNTVQKSPLDIQGINTKITAGDIVEVLKETRERSIS